MYIYIYFLYIMCIYIYIYIIHDVEITSLTFAIPQDRVHGYLRETRILKVHPRITRRPTWMTHMWRPENA